MNNTKLMMTALDTTKSKSSPKVPRRTSKHKTLRQQKAKEERAWLIFGTVISIGIPLLLMLAAVLIGALSV